MTPLQALTLARSHGVSPAALHLLLVVIDDSPIRPTRIAEATGITPAAVTGACNRLVRDGWLRRFNNPDDRRSWHVVPTGKAFEVFSGMVGP